MYPYADVCKDVIGESKLTSVKQFTNIEVDDAHNIQLYYHNVDLLKEAQARKTPSKFYAVTVDTSSKCNNSNSNNNSSNNYAQILLTPPDSHRKYSSSSAASSAASSPSVSSCSSLLGDSDVNTGPGSGLIVPSNSLMVSQSTTTTITTTETHK
jgi:hypothetical protein